METKSIVTIYQAKIEVIGRVAFIPTPTKETGHEKKSIDGQTLHIGATRYCGKFLVRTFQPGDEGEQNHRKGLLCKIMNRITEGAKRVGESSRQFGM